MVNYEVVQANAMTTNVELSRMHVNEYFKSVVTCFFRVINQICSVRVKYEKKLLEEPQQNENSQRGSFHSTTFFFNDDCDVFLRYTNTLKMFAFFIRMNCREQRAQLTASEWVLYDALTQFCIAICCRNVLTTLKIHYLFLLVFFLLLNLLQRPLYTMERLLLLRHDS